MRILIIISMLALCVAVVSGCDPLTRYKVTSIIFDGVPSLPSAEQYCKDYHIQATLEDKMAEQKKQQNAVNESIHPPYGEKRCNDCHNKDTESGFVVAADALCAHCHKDFPVGNYLHGPAAVGSCNKCHLPHTSANPNLLIKPKGELCDVCHAEARTAKGLHSNSLAKGMVCTDCHDPHGGDNRFFLR